MVQFRAGHALARIRVAAVLLGVAPMMVSAQNLVTNGSFESGLTGWTMNRNDCASFVNNLFTGPAYSGTKSPGVGIAEDGASEMGFGAVSCTPGISEDLTTIAGQTYNLGFWFVLGPSQLNIPNVFSVSVDGDVLGSGQITQYAWTQFTTSFVGTGDDKLSFSGNNPNGVTYLDNVRVIAVTPEPGTMTLMATGLVGLVGSRLRRRKRA